ncbi:hypothetical protein [Streptomyces thermolilacinus]|uniref:hypothetical protein n=1 Tax=Streptomyces thermolilacinus TaxID=285540 RepID=UPI0033FF8E8B
MRPHGEPPVGEASGDRNPRGEVLAEGPYRERRHPAGPYLLALAHRLLRVLDATHDRDVVVRDL